MIEDFDGAVIVIELETDAPTVVEDVALYAHGDKRTSSAARRGAAAHPDTPGGP